MTMDVFLAGTPVSLVVSLQDRSGNAIEASAVEYRIIKQGGEEVFPRAVLDSFAGDEEVTIEIPAHLNDLASVDHSTMTHRHVDSVSVREVRTVELYLTVGGNTVLMTKSYVLEPAESLVPGLNSFQTLPEAEMMALDVPGLHGWAGATEREKMAALVDARARIIQLRFNLLNSNINWGQDNLNFVPEGTYPTPYAGVFMFNGNLGLLTPAHYGRLPPRFKSALCKAQVVEADVLLGGDPTDDRRKDGLMLESIGEVKQMFRPGKPLDLPISKRALRYLSPFVSFSKRIGRG